MGDPSIAGRLGVGVLLVLGCGGLPGRSEPPPRPTPMLAQPVTPLEHTVLVTGFGDFLDVTDNPSGRLAASVDGEVVEGWRIVGKVLEVSYAGAPARTIAAANAHHAGLVIGLGLDDSRAGVFVERYGYAGGDGRTLDVDDVTRAPSDGLVVVSIDLEGFARALGGTISEDPGRYVCNSWIYDVRTALPDRPVGFVHLPPEGLGKDRFLAALGDLIRAL